MQSTLKNAILALTTAATAATFAVTAHADGHENPAVNARQGYMQLMSLNIGVLGQMARGNTEYDAETAQAAANNLLTLSQIDQRFMWVPGTDTENMEGTRALPAIWADDSRVMEIMGEFNTAAEGLAATAGDGLDALRAGLGPVGSACGDCHDDYRQPQ
ncbi:c-type cytochrome [Gymnodinialimonas ceratoperidinii]|uniref:Cytochrome c n=1 Tax=Gymnodinialimonas ceratoperidinii TaxID=2856823 RepID=A0A8F6TSU5_9RHOB|nr:cytochrome c [Gymnodinialimonas ceratoperidinii]QXT38321.1 cytochrome c [Gymnodinialimonas ceratoperidinii]